MVLASMGCERPSGAGNTGQEHVYRHQPGGTEVGGDLWAEPAALTPPGQVEEECQKQRRAARSSSRSGPPAFRKPYRSYRFLLRRWMFRRNSSTVLSTSPRLRTNSLASKVCPQEQVKWGSRLSRPIFSFAFLPQFGQVISIAVSSNISSLPLWLCREDSITTCGESSPGSEKNNPAGFVITLAGLATQRVVLRLSGYAASERHK